MTKELLNYLLIAETVPLAVGLIQIVFISMPFSGCLCVCVCKCVCLFVSCLFACLLACFMVCLLACMFRMRSYLKTQDFKEELCSKLCMAVDKFSPNRQWQIETCSAKVHLWSLNKFNMGPQNQPLGKEMLSLETIIFRFRFLSSNFWGVTMDSKVWATSLRDPDSFTSHCLQMVFLHHICMVLYINIDCHRCM